MAFEGSNVVDIDTASKRVIMTSTERSTKRQRVPFRYETKRERSIESRVHVIKVGSD